MVREQLPLILDVQGEEWWQDVTLPMLEVARKRLRDLVKFIDKAERKIVFTDFEDEMGVEQAVAIAGLQSAIDVATYRKKMERYLRDHENHIAIRKLKTNEPLTPVDLQERAWLLFESSDVGTREDFERAYGPQESLGAFVRRLVGLDREAAKGAFAAHLTGSLFNANQIRFVNQVIDDLTANGIMELARLYEPPYTDLSPAGLDGIFDDAQADQIVKIIRRINNNAGSRATA
jgi:type I restriction enzyme R subunit